MKKKVLVGVGIVIVLAIIVIGAILVSSGGNTGLFLASGSSTKEIKVALISSLSGDASVWGQGVKKGFDFALDEINSSGGINGKKLVAIYEDDQCDAKTGLTAFNEAIGVQGAKIVVGTVCSSVAFSVAKLVEQEKVLYIASGATQKDVAKQGEHIFTLWIADSYEAKILADFADQNLGFKNFAMMYLNDNPAGLAIKDAFLERVNGNGGKVLAVESFSSTEKDFKSIITKIISVSPQAIYVNCMPGQMPLLINDLRTAGYKGIIFAYATSIYSKEISGAVKDKSNIYFALPLEEHATSFWAEYKAKTGEDPDMLTALGYDSAKILQEPLRKCGEDTDCLKDALSLLKDYASSRGLLNFDEYGALTAVPFEIKKVN